MIAYLFICSRASMMYNRLLRRTLIAFRYPEPAQIIKNCVIFSRMLIIVWCIMALQEVKLFTKEEEEEEDV